MRIEILSPELANQIAAGEVVDRPAAVIKELLENSIDAGATQINIDVEQGGVQFLRVRDNGYGIHPDDMRLALHSHATSKIKNIRDLDTIASLGFRGEALASISAVSRLTLSSRHKESEQAYAAKVAGKDQTVELIPVAHPQGTTVEVAELFFNVPARRKFLRTPATEFFHIEEMVKRLALSRQNIAFKLTHNEQVILDLKAATDDLDLERRVGKILGRQFISNAVQLDAAIDDLRLCGWLGLPACARSQLDAQYFFVNGRMVRDKLISHAVRQAYGETLPPGRYAQYVLYLSVEPQIVDVNVHPTKQEVRFRDTRLIHDFILNGLSSSLREGGGQLAYTPAPPVIAVQPVERQLSVAEPVVRYQAEPVKTMSTIKVAQPQAAFVKQTPPQEIKESKEIESLPSIGKLQALIHRHYALLETTLGLAIINLQTVFAAERSEQFHQALRQKSIMSKPLLVPVVITLTYAQALLMRQHEEQLGVLGFIGDLLPDKTYLLRSVPSLLTNADPTELFYSLLEVLPQKKTSLEWIAVLVRHLALQKTFTIAETQAFLDKCEPRFLQSAIKRWALEDLP